VRTLVTAAGERIDATFDEVRARMAGREGGFWLDIEGPDADDYRLLLDELHFHPLTVEDVQLQNQRPKLDEFAGYKFAVLFTATLDGDEVALREHHLYLTPHCLISLHQEPAPALDDVRQRIADTPDVTRGELGFLEYLVVNALVECLFPTLDALDERIDTVEDRVLLRATPDALSRITRLKHEVAELRRVLGAQRDVFQRLLNHSLERRGGHELTLYWRDVYENLIRQYEQVDSLRDLLTGAMDVYMSTESNRLNTTMKQLTVITTVFLPLTFITGFFGMNFSWMVEHIGGLWPFAAGTAVMVVAVVVQLAVFRRWGWI
jgi:magnesium transporter